MASLGGGARRCVRPSELVDELMTAILGDLQPKPGSQVLLHVNGFGGTPLIELYLLYHCASQLLEGKGLKAVRSLVGNYTTSLEMAGASITVTMMDEEMKSLWDAPVHTAALRW